MPSSLLQKTFGNAAALYIGSALEGVLQFAFLIIAGRALGPENFGFYGYLISILTFVLVVTNWGLPVIIVRELAQRPQEEARLFASMFRVRASFAVIFFLSALAVLFSQPLESIHRTAIGLIFLYLLFVPFDLAPIFDAQKLSRWDVPGKVSGRIASVVTLFVLWTVRGTLTVADIAACASLLMLVNVTVAWCIARKLGLTLRPFGPQANTWQLMRISAYVMWGNLMLTTYTFSQTILVKWLSTDLQTGFYAMASRLLMPVFIAKGILQRLLLPIVSEVAEDQATFTGRLERAIPALTLLFAPVAGLGIPAAEIFIVPILGSDYAGAILPLQISLSHFIITGSGSLYGTALLAAGDQKTPTWGLTIGCAVGVGMSLLLIPAHGAVGAAWSVLIAALVSVLFPLPFFLRRWQPKIGWRLLCIISSSAAGTAGFYLLTSYLSLSDLIALGASAVIILIGLWLSGEISRSKIETLISLFRRESQS